MPAPSCYRPLFGNSIGVLKPVLVLIAGLAIFFAVHSVSIVNEPWRDAMVARLGPMAWRGIYSLAALLGLALIIWGYGLARQQPLLLYPPTIWLHRLALVLLVPVFPLVLAAYLPGHIKATVKHPMLLAIKLWALAHLLANGMFADVVLFGSFLIWAVANRISMKRRTPRPVSSLRPSVRNDIVAIVLGLVLYMAFSAWVHRWLIGVAPTFV